MALVLLPLLSDPVTAYSPTLQAAFQKKPSSRIDVAVTLTSPLSTEGDSRGTQFPRFQAILKSFYEAVLAAADSTPLDLPGGIDARVFLLDLSHGKDAKKVAEAETLSGPLISASTLINSGHVYQYVFAPDSEAGHKATDTLLNLSRSRPSPTFSEIETLPSGPSMQASDIEASPENVISPVHHSVAVGGTFDHLHIGHKLLLTATVFIAEPSTSTHCLITIGITGDALLVNKKHASALESWATRQSRTADFVESILTFHPDISSIKKTEEISNSGPNGHTVKVSYGEYHTINYTEISDPFGPTITDENISALVISEETRAGGGAVNKKRKEQGWKELEAFEVGLLSPHGKADMTEKISSTEIRRKVLESDPVS